MPGLVQTGIQFVEIVQGHSLGEHRCAESAFGDLPVMADDEVLQSCLEISRKVRESSQMFLEDLKANRDMPDQLTPGRVGRAPRQGQLFDLSQIVQDGSGYQPVAIQPGVRMDQQICSLTDCKHVFEESAPVCVMKACRRRSHLERLRNVRILQNRL